MYNRIDPKVKQVSNAAMHNFGGVVKNKTACHLGQYSLHLLLLKNSIYGVIYIPQLKEFA